MWNRVKLICPEEHVLEDRLYDLKTWLMGFIGTHCYRKRINWIWESTMAVKLVLTYHPAVAKRVYHIVTEAHKLIERSDILRAILPIPSRVAFRNAKSLKDMLVRSKLKPVGSNLRKRYFQMFF